MNNYIDNHSPKDVFWLESNEHLELLGDATRLEIIELLMMPASVAELAERMKVPRTRLYHHINQLEQAGFIRVVGTRQAGLQTEKIYRAAAHHFQPSNEFMQTALPREKAQAILKSIIGSTQVDFIRSVESGEAPLEDSEEARRTHVSRRLLLLTPERLHEFITELEALLERFEVNPLPAVEFPSELMVIGVLNLVYPSSRGK